MTAVGPTAIAIPGSDLVTVVFHWSRDYGDCDECGLPAAFHSVNAYGIDKHQPLCCVCAANAASDGDTIRRIDA